jgi:1,4-alpha-glucan branching enzyme/maltooligosyltrehalose trehalohydrolase
MGERLSMLAAPERVRLAMAMLLLAPSVPLLFMGEEFAARTPFLYFCDFKGELADAVREGRRREFASFARSAGEGAREAIPDPNDARTLVASRLDWASLDKPAHAAALEHFGRLTDLRASMIVPRLARGEAHGTYTSSPPGLVCVDWTLGEGSRLHLRANLSDDPGECAAPEGRLLHVEGTAPEAGRIAPWSAAWWLLDLKGG